MLQCVAVSHGSVLGVYLCVPLFSHTRTQSFFRHALSRGAHGKRVHILYSVLFARALRCVAVCCSVSQYARVAVCCSVLQCESSVGFFGWYSYIIQGGALGVSQEKRRVFGIFSRHQSSRIL